MKVSLEIEDQYGDSRRKKEKMRIQTSRFHLKCVYSDFESKAFQIRGS